MLRLLLARFASAVLGTFGFFLRFLLPAPGPCDGLSPEACDRCARRFAEDAVRRCGGDGSGDLPWAPLGYQRLLSRLSDGTYVRDDDGHGADVDDGGTSGTVPLPSLVLVYLHSPIHRRAAPFATDVLRDPHLLAAVEEHRLICWGGDISRSAEADALARSLGVAAFPALALVGCPPVQDYLQQTDAGATGRRTRTAEVLLLRAGYPEGSSPAASLRRLLADVRNAARRHRRVTAEARAVRDERTAEVRLRREQDDEYQQTLRADRLREEARVREREAAAAAAEEVRRAAQEAEERQAAERGAARARLGEEPGQGEPGTCRVRVAAPCGGRLDRRFRQEDVVGRLRDFLTVYWEDAEAAAVVGVAGASPARRGKAVGRIKNYSLSTNFPRKLLDDDDMTLVDAGLVPQGVVMVQDLDA